MSSSTSLTTRIIIWIIAITFAVSSLGISIAVIWQSFDKKNDIENAQADKKTLAGSKLEDFTPITKVDALQVVDLQPGTGREVKAGDTVTVDYTGAFANSGLIFESSLDAGQQLTSKLAEEDILKGWVQGVPGMKEGGKRRLVIPASLAYGEAGQGSIPPNTDLVFDITLHLIGE